MIKLSRQKIFIIFLGTLALFAGGYFYFAQHITRYAVFAGYNANGTIPSYVITYLQELNKVTDGVVYITDSPLNHGEEKKIEHLVLHSQHIRHNEYDWGSYKRGFNWLKRKGYLDKTDELIFANDSCYAPLDSFQPMFDKMSNRPELDFWGNSQNSAFMPHIQSYFMVFRKPVFNLPQFSSFINNITHQEFASMYITSYEVPFTSYLANLGYKWDSFIPYQNFPLKDETDINSYPLTAISKFHNQFLKRRTFTNKLRILEDRSELLNFIKQNYPNRWNDIITEISPHFIPEHLKEIN